MVVAYYCPEPLSRRAERAIRSQARPAISELTEVELISALARKTRNRELTREDVRRIMAQFQTHVEENLYTRVALNRRHYKSACELIGRFTSSLRTLDAIHLAVAATEGFQFVTADEPLFRSAKVVGVSVVWLRVGKN